MPTFLYVYTNVQANPMLRKAIEYCCRQFYILHRIPFVLQMLGSISPSFDFEKSINSLDTDKIQQMALFRLLTALEQADIDAMNDDYSILELVKKPSLPTRTINIPTETMASVVALGQSTMIVPPVIKSLDFCYADDDTMFTLLNCFDVCVTVGKWVQINVIFFSARSIVRYLLLFKTIW